MMSWSKASLNLTASLVSASVTACAEPCPALPCPPAALARRLERAALLAPQLLHHLPEALDGGLVLEAGVEARYAAGRGGVQQEF
jgi:hypothetical protein